SKYRLRAGELGKFHVWQPLRFRASTIAKNGQLPASRLVWNRPRRAAQCASLNSPRGVAAIGVTPLLSRRVFGRCDFRFSIGAGEGIRTLDPDLGKVVLYH